MIGRIKRVTLDLMPPMLARTIRHWRQQKTGVAFSGDFESWSEATKCSMGYDEPSILNKAIEALLKVKSGEARFERDTVIFDVPDYSYPLLAALLNIALKLGRALSVLDIGGSLGSTYYQVKGYASDRVLARWSIVEQAHFVEAGRKFFGDDILRFYGSLSECLLQDKPDVVLLSSVVQYIELPMSMLNELVEYEFRYIVFDRTPVLEGRPTRLTVQKVPPQIYEATYPCWMLNKDQLIAPFRGKYRLLDEFHAHIGTIIDLGDTTAEYRGFVFERIGASNSTETGAAQSRQKHINRVTGRNT